MVVLELHDLGRVADVHHPLLDELEGELLQRRRLVHGQRVVHVEPEKLDLLQVQRAVHENPAGKTEWGRVTRLCPDSLVCLFGCLLGFWGTSTARLFGV